MNCMLLIAFCVKKSKQIKTQVRKELADQRENVKVIREELAREKLKLAQALVEMIGEVEALKPPGA